MRLHALKDVRECRVIVSYLALCAGTVRGTVIAMASQFCFTLVLICGHGFACKGFKVVC